MSYSRSSNGEFDDMSFDLVFEKPTLTPDRKKRNTGNTSKRRVRQPPIHLASHNAFVDMLDSKETVRDKSLPYIPSSSRKRGGKRTRRRTGKHKRTTMRRKSKSSTKRRKKTNRRKK